MYTLIYVKNRLRERNLLVSVRIQKYRLKLVSSPRDYSSGLLLHRPSLAASHSILKRQMCPCVLVSKLKLSRFWHVNSKRVWNLDLLKTENLENARVRGRGSEIYLASSLSHPRSLALALSHSRALRFINPVYFRHVWGFHVKTSRFYF